MGPFCGLLHTHNGLGRTSLMILVLSQTWHARVLANFTQFDGRTIMQYEGGDIRGLMLANDK